MRCPAFSATLATSAVLAAASAALAADWPQWRGPDRNGISNETGLLDEWPEQGPPRLWQITDLGEGYSTPSVVDGRLYIMDNRGLDDEFVKALDAKDGTEIWSTRVGKVGNPDQKPSYPAARSTPTVDGEFLYALGSDGDLVCLKTSNGDVRWRKSLRADFAGKPGEWAYAESPLVDGDKVVCTPGGSEATIVALDKHSGGVVWKCALPEADGANYSSAVVADAAGVRQYVQLLQKGLVGVDARTGKLLWRYEKPVSIYDANIPTPLVAGDFIYVASAGTGGGTVKLTAEDGTIQPEELYFDAKMPTAIGGAVKIGEYLYGTTSQSMLCIEFATGKVMWQDRALGAASLLYADDRLVLHSEEGEVALVEPSPESYVEKGRFTPSDRPEPANPKSKSWAYPVVADGRLYIRDENSLWCYDVKAP